MKKESKKFDRRVITDKRIRKKRYNGFDKRMFNRRGFNPKGARLVKFLSGKISLPEINCLKLWINKKNGN